MNSRVRSFAFLFPAALGLAVSAVPALADSAEVVLRLNQRVSMEELAKSVTDPSSVRYRKFYTSDEIRDIAGPSDADYSRILSELKANGATIISESPTHLLITVRADRAYLVKLQAQLNSPLLRTDAVAQLAAVHGLAPSAKRHPKLRFTPRKPTDGVQPATIKTLYGFDALYTAGLTGKGQQIAIATYDGFYIDDVNKYYSLNNLNPAPQVDEVVFNGQPTYDPGSAAETQTDAEFSGMIAPGASIHVFASSQNSDVGELAMFTAILDDGRAKIVNYSWGMCEAQVAADHKTAMDQVFARAVAQGVNIMVASGDSGSDCLGQGTASADFPASNPNIVAVGGTTITNTSGALTEAAWSGSGGGISTLYDKPSYQTGLDSTTYAHRSYPDVAFNADPNSGQPTWIHYDPNNPSVPPANASYLVIGGTSIAAPQWSGFLALVSEAKAGKALGFLNPLIYGVSSSDFPNFFDDVTSGSNGKYTAGAGWDAVTGFGSMKAADLLGYLQKL